MYVVPPKLIYVKGRDLWRWEDLFGRYHDHKYKLTAWISFGLYCWRNRVPTDQSGIPTILTR
jgi:hypothetical protein